MYRTCMRTYMVCVSRKVHYANAMFWKEKEKKEASLFSCSSLFIPHCMPISDASKEEEERERDELDAARCIFSIFLFPPCPFLLFSIFLPMLVLYFLSLHRISCQMLPPKMNGWAFIWRCWDSPYYLPINCTVRGNPCIVRTYVCIHWLHLVIRVGQSTVGRV